MRKIFLLIVLAMLFASVGCENYVETHVGKLTVEFLNTGNSDCILMRIDDKLVLIDTADEDDYTMIYNRIRALGTTKIDYMIITHFDNDHVGSAAELISYFDVGEVIVPNYIDNTKLYRKMQTSLEASDETVYSVLTSDKTINTQNGKIYINIPKSKSYEDENDYSLITMVSFMGKNLLFTGDALKTRLSEFDDELFADNHADIQKIDLIKTPHHGDYNKALKKLFDKSGANIAVVTTDSIASVENKLTKLFSDNGINAYMSYEGAVTVELVDDTLKVSQ